MEYPNHANRPSYSSVTHEDSDAQAESLVAFDQQYVQLDPGPFSGTMATCDFGTGLIISFEHVSKRVFQIAAAPKDSVQIALILESETPSVFKSIPCSKNSAIIMAPGSETQLSAAAGMKVCLVSIAGMAAEKLRQDHQLEPNDLSSDIVLHPNRTHSLRGLVAEAYDRFSLTNIQETMNQFELDSFQNAILGVTAWAYSQHVGEIPSSMATKVNHNKVMSQALILIDQNLGSEISANWLAERLGVSRRSLDNIFGNSVDMGPSQYVKTYRLNKLRKLLQDPRNRGVSIGDLAAQCGLWHLSRMASEYRTHFGLLPSETQARLGVGFER